MSIPSVSWLNVCQQNVCYLLQTFSRWRQIIEFWHKPIKYYTFRVYRVLIYKIMTELFRLRSLWNRTVKHSSNVHFLLIWCIQLLLWKINKYYTFNQIFQPERTTLTQNRLCQNRTTSIYVSYVCAKKLRFCRKQLEHILESPCCYCL